MFGGGTTNTTVRIMTRRIVGLSAVAGLGAIVYSQYFTKDGNPLSSISTHSFLSQTLMASDNSASSTSHLNDSESILAHSKAFQNESKPISLWTPPSRADMLKRIKEKGPEGEFDLLVIGGGATGTGVALDAATRGLKVAMVERDDFASGASTLFNETLLQVFFDCLLIIPFLSRHLQQVHKTGSRWCAILGEGGV